VTETTGSGNGAGVPSGYAVAVEIEVPSFIIAGASGKAKSVLDAGESMHFLFLLS
jgi:hypothetical protein